MKDMFSALARLLIAAAGARAASRTHARAEARLARREAYTSNAGGWN